MTDKPIELPQKAKFIGRYDDGTEEWFHGSSLYIRFPDGSIKKIGTTNA